MLSNKPLLCTLLASTALLSVSQAMAAPALPTHATVVSGQAAISAPASGLLTVSQSSQNAIINWNSFSIGQGGTVQINNGSGATLNRVTGSSISSIDGLLSATGSVYLINPNGVIIGKTGVVNTGGSFVASTLDISNNAFLGGGALTFSGPSTASVFNLGKVGSLGGNVALIAQTVENDGTITAPGGTVGLVAGQQVTLKDADNDGNGLFSVQLGGSKTSVTNTGLIAAANAELRAEQGNVYALAGNTAGVIRATGVGKSDGKIWLVADGGTTTVAGTLDAQGANGAAGQIETSGQTVSVDASTIDAHGGQWLLDPQNIEITAAAANTISSSLANNDVTEQTTSTTASETGTGAATTVSSGAGDITLDAGASISWGSSHALTLSAYNNLNLNGSISLSGGTLNLTAGQAITVNAPITVSGAGAVNLTYSAASAADLSFGLTPAGFAGSLSFTGTPGSGQSLIINGQAYRLLYALTDSTAAAGNGPDTGADDLAGIDNNTAGGGDAGHYALAIDLTGLSGAQFSASLIGAGATAFTGVFEGLGHTINSFNLSDTQAVNISLGGSAPVNPYIGLFGQIGAGGLVEHIGLTNTDVTGGIYNYDTSGPVNGPSPSPGQNLIYLGTIAGTNAGTILQSFSTGNVRDGSNDGPTSVGGLVGFNLNGSVVSSYSTAQVIGSFYSEYVGGLVGYSSGGTIEQSGASGYVTGYNFIGGLVGSTGTNITQSYFQGTVVSYGSAGDVGGLVGLNSGASITQSYSTGDVTSPDGEDLPTGGLVGFNSAGSILQSFATGGVTGSGDVGGLVGSNNGTIGQSYATGAVTSTGANTGGLVGYNDDGDSSISQSYATGSVQGGDATGGLIGYAPYGTISQDYATGSVSGDRYVGGLIGFTAGVISQTYASGLVSGSGNVGALIGYNNGASISSSYWDKTTSGVSVGFGAGNESDATGLTSAQFTNPANFVGFNFTSTPGQPGWVIVDSDGTLNGTNGATRPMLASEYSTTISSAHQLQLMVMDPTAAYVLNSDIDLSVLGDTSDVWIGATTGFIPIGSTSTPFTGSLNGQDHVIDGLVIHSSTDPAVGLFSVIGAQGMVDNVALTNASVTTEFTGNGYLGILAGYNHGTVQLSYSSGSVTEDGATPNAANAGVGGLVGGNSGTISESASGAAVTSNSGGDYVGGLVGALDQGNVEASYATGTVTAMSGGQSIGGLVGDAGNANPAFITQSYATGAVSGVSDAGGLLGSSNGATITTSYATGAVSGANVGGLVGVQSNGSISSSYASGAVSGNYAGGLVGQLGFSSISNAYATGAVTGQYASGGLVGAISNGGVTDAYATGAVGSATYAGDVIGSRDDSQYGVTLTHVYYDSNTTGQTGVTSAVGAGGSATGITALTTAQFSSPAKFAGFIFTTTPGATGNAWVIVDSDGTLNGTNGATRPMLASEYSTTVSNGHQLELMTMNLGAAYALDSDIDLSATASASDVWKGASSGFIPVGSVAHPFTGSLDGQDYTIANLTIDRPTSDYVGLISDLGAGGAIINLEIDAPTVTGRNDTGAVAGYTQSSALLNNDFVEAGLVTGANYVGGLVGYNTGAVSLVQAAAANVSGSNYVGGLIGYNTGALVTDVSYIQTVSGANYVGGLVGYNTGGVSFGQAYDTSISGSNYVGGGIGYSTGGDLITDTTYAETVIGVNYVGGVVGYLNSGTLSDAQSVSNIQAIGTYAGGLVGYNAGAVYGGAAYEGDIGPTLFGTINGASDVGGAAGYNTSTGTLNYTKAYGDVTGTGANTGGLVGYNAGGISNSLAEGQVSGQNFTGGLTGYNRGTITSISADTTNQVVGGAIWVGGLTGYNSGTIGATNGAVASNATVTATGDASGGLVGQNVGTVTNAAASGSVSGLNQVGGLIGVNGGGVTGSSASASVNATGYIGGLIGYNSGSVSSSSATGQVSGQTLVGGLVGYNTATGTITNISADTTAQVVDGAEFVGGLVGYNLGSVGAAGSTVASNATVTDTGSKAGGSIGYNIGTVTNAMAAGSVSGIYDDGGLIGQVDAGSVTGSSSSSTVNGATYVGGLVGYAAAGTSLSGDSASGSVTGTGTFAGGLVGLDRGSVSNSSATGNVSGVYDVGGLIGYVANGAVLSGDTASGSATATYDYAGGLVGNNFGAITSSSATGQVSGRNFDGGLTGYNDGTITNITADATPQIVGGVLWVGGLTGYNAGTIGASGSSVASNATVTAAGDDAGGLVGENIGSITGASAAGSVSGLDYVGGLVGYNFHGTVVSSTVTASYSSPGTHKGAVYGANLP